MPKNIAEREVRVGTLKDFTGLLSELTGFSIAPTPSVAQAIDGVIQSVGVGTSDLAGLRSRFYGRINQKLFASRPILKTLYSHAARSGVTFNYPAKKAIAWAVDAGDLHLFNAALAAQDVTAELADELRVLFDPVPHAETRRLLQAETTKPSKLRKAHERDVVQDVVDSSVGPLVWSLWDELELHRHFGSMPTSREYTGEFLTDLRRVSPDLFERARSLVVRHVRESTDRRAFLEYAQERDGLCSWLASEFNKVDNYGFVAVVLHANTPHGRERAWRLSADLTLYGERFNETAPDCGFFRSDWVAEETLRHNTDVDAEAARFELMTDGYTYRDLFVLTEGDLVSRLLLVFQKNERDETLIPCPTCRSDYVRGNSYPTLGVKSWECRNALCPERSIYNRGKRYSFKGLLSQEAIEHPENEIPVSNVRRWQRDVLEFRGDREVEETLIRHYSMVHDPVVLIDSPTEELDSFGRHQLAEASSPAELSAEFWASSPFFHRYIPAKDLPVVSTDSRLPTDDAWEVVEGDSLSVLREFENDVFDRAVTSPPYFNARDYAQWSNLYCFLYDMTLVSSEVFRVLKPGAEYAFNIFDYFDNERIITHSAMGKKRIPLSALMGDIFRRSGFDYVGAIVWDKGEIEGKRGFNAGNFSPFYQSPFNCWEHVMVLRKPGPPLGRSLMTNRVARIKPVVKMVKGENTYGHTAPFPLDLPALLLDGLPKGSVVLDPYGGSGTTARAATDAGLRSVLIDRDADYCALSRRLIDAHTQQAQARGSTPTLF